MCRFWSSARTSFDKIAWNYHFSIQSSYIFLIRVIPPFFLTIFIMINKSFQVSFAIFFLFRSSAHTSYDEITQNADLQYVKTPFYTPFQWVFRLFCVTLPSYELCSHPWRRNKLKFFFKILLLYIFIFRVIRPWI